MFIELQKHLWKFRRTQKSCGNTCLLACVPKAFLILPSFHSYIYNLVITMVHVYYFLYDNEQKVMSIQKKITKEKWSQNVDEISQLVL